MTSTLSRRDILKLLPLYGTGLFLPKIFHQALPLQSISGDSDKPNVLIIVFDAWSAQHISLYDYPRLTTPNIDRLAEKAIVYHNHYAGSNFTTPGTASLLTGTLPWTHRAINHNDTVKNSFINKSIFHAFPDYYRMAYSHNPLANTILKQFFADIEALTRRERLFLETDLLATSLFGKDEDIASVSWERAIKQSDGYSYLLFLPRLYEYFRKMSHKDISSQFPRGLPFINEDNTFILEDGVDWLQGSIATASSPFLAYYHFLPPHHPYNTRLDFYNHFENDGYRPVEKPLHPYFAKDRSKDSFYETRSWYDEFILYCDAEFGRLFEFLENSGYLENTWVVLTSDHGEMFDRGISGHLTPVLFNPLMRVPLVIFPPGQNERIDVHAKTSAIDVLPTLAKIAGQSPPAWSEGRLMPPFNPDYQNNPPDVIGIRAKGIEKTEPINRGTFMIVRDNFKAVYYLGYDGKTEKWGEYVELYDLDNDPEELVNLAEKEPEIAKELGDILFDQLERKNNEMHL